MEGFQNEIRPIKGSDSSARISLSKDERPWMRWLVRRLYKLLNYLAHVASSTLQLAFDVLLSGLQRASNIFLSGIELIPPAFRLLLKKLEANPPYHRVSKRYGRH